jgi:hypothetical protein
VCFSKALDSLIFESVSFWGSGLLMILNLNAHCAFGNSSIGAHVFDFALVVFCVSGDSAKHFRASEGQK